METINIQLYELCRHDLHLSDAKSLELMNILNAEYKSGVKEDLKALSKQMQDGFDKVDERFDKIDARFTSQDERIAALDKKLDVRIGDVRVEISNSKNETNRYILGLFLAILLSFIALFLKK